LRALLLGPGDYSGPDVGVVGDMVGVGAVAGVLADPPAIAQSDSEVAEEQAHQSCVLPGAEYLPVSDVMGEERDLGECDSEDGGDDDL
jgi:hypothetical protein